MKSVLIVEDEEDLCTLIASQIRTETTKVDEALSAEKGLELLQQASYDLVITDIRLPGMDGIEMMKKALSELDHKPTFFVMSGFSDYTKEEILAAGGEMFFSKPADIAILFSSVEEKLS
jgi:two-component system nitrogen regulation response regulator NtrX